MNKGFILKNRKLFDRLISLVSAFAIASPIKPCQKMPLKIKFIKDDDEGILPYCEEEDAEKFYFQQILTARFSWGSNNIFKLPVHSRKNC
jgi:hypothetical protein